MIPPAFGKTSPSTIQKVRHVSLYPPKSTFSGDYISASRGCWPDIFTHARHWPKLASTHHKPGRDLQNI